MSEPVVFLDGRVRLYAGDCIRVLAELEAESVHSIVTDPPYHLSQTETRNLKRASPDPAQRARVTPERGFMGKSWDGGDIAFDRATWAAALRVLKPGGHLVAFGGTRTYHRMACAIEDAGFEIRDMLAWLYGQGFPKSLNVAIEYEKRLCHRVDRDGAKAWVYVVDGEDMRREPPFRDDDANEWAGWGTAFKPALEPVCFARKPLIGTVADNVLKHAAGAINIDAGRVPVSDAAYAKNAAGDRGHANNRKRDMDFALGSGRAHDLGRWPTNLAHDGSPEVLAAFPRTASGTGAIKKTTAAGHQNNAYGKESRAAGTPNVEYGDEGSATRFFYTAKADADDRIASKHPTVKPVDLMCWLVRVVTPPGGVILDPFAGTGTTGEAAWREGFNAILIEREPEYQADIARRMDLCKAGPAGRKRAIAKAKARPDDTAGPLFGGATG